MAVKKPKGRAPRIGVRRRKPAKRDVKPEPLGLCCCKPYFPYAWGCPIHERTVQ